MEGKINLVARCHTCDNALYRNDGEEPQMTDKEYLADTLAVNLWVSANRCNFCEEGAPLSIESLTKNISVKQVQDNDGHWYWIPVSLVSGFNVLIQQERHNDINLLFSDFRTNGHQDNKPEAFCL